MTIENVRNPKEYRVLTADVEVERVWVGEEVNPRFVRKADGSTLTGAGSSAPTSTQSAGIADASEAHALNSTFSDTEVEAALDALGVKVNAIIAALEAAGITATV